MTRPASRARRGAFTWALWLAAGLISLGAAAASIYALLLGRQAAVAVAYDQAIYAPLLITAWAGVGGLILARYRGHSVGWLMLLLSLLLLYSHAYFILRSPLLALGQLPLDAFIPRFLDWSLRWTWMLYSALPAIFLLLYFPTGRLPSPRWRIISGTAVVGLASAVTSFAVEPGSEEWGLNPFMFPNGASIARILEIIGAPALGLAMVGSLAAMVWRYRQAEWQERQQIKWLFYPLGVFLVWMLFHLFWPFLSPGSSGSDATLPFTLLNAAIPLAIGIAILRYRLYDIDILIRRTLIYGLLTVMLALVYFGGVLLLQNLFAAIVGSGRSPLITVISTLAIVVLFNPLRRRIQAFIDRRFYRRKYDAALTLARFSAAARDEVDAARLTATLMDAILETMQPETAGIWLREGALPPEDPRLTR